MQTILVGYDEGEPAKRALARAADLAKAFGGKLVVTSVARAFVPAGHGLGPEDPVDTLAEHDEQLRHASALLAEHGVEADMIVVGTREPGFSARLFGLSVSGDVQRHARCDVLIVH
jgi:nucleotide-binding universal stress UspA family protein